MNFKYTAADKATIFTNPIIKDARAVCGKFQNIAQNITTGVVI